MYHCIARSSRGNSGCGIAVAPVPRWMGRSSRRSGSRIVGFRTTFGHAESVELVTVRIAEVGGVEPAAAHPGRTLVAAAVRQRQRVHAVDLRIVPGLERD